MFFKKRENKSADALQNIKDTEQYFYERDLLDPKFAYSLDHIAQKPFTVNAFLKNNAATLLKECMPKVFKRLPANCTKEGLKDEGYKFVAGIIMEARKDLLPGEDFRPAILMSIDVDFELLTDIEPPMPSLKYPVTLSMLVEYPGNENTEGYSKKLDTVYCNDAESFTKQYQRMHSFVLGNITREKYEHGMYHVFDAYWHIPVKIKADVHGTYAAAKSKYPDLQDAINYFALNYKPYGDKYYIAKTQDTIEDIRKKYNNNEPDIDDLDDDMYEFNGYEIR